MQVQGRCLVIYAFDVARAVDLKRAAVALAAGRETRFQHKVHLPADGVAAPLRLIWPASPAQEALARHGFDAEAEVAVYDFGALAVTFRGGVAQGLDRRALAPLEDLVRHSAALYANRELEEAARAVALDVLAHLGAAAERPLLHPLVEDYVVFELSSPAGDLEAALQRSRAELARVLRAEEKQLSEQEVSSALANRVAYGIGDAALVDWLAAILFGDDHGDVQLDATLDERLVLELATIELLELRVLDRQLDVELNLAYSELARPKPRFWSWRTRRAELERIARAEADDALLHEGIDNALALFGDDYLARLYRVAAQRFHFDSFDAAIQRKLSVIARIHERLAEQAARRRSEVLEWIIIALIAIDIVIYFTPLR